MVKIIINGKFMSQNITGVQRYAREILLELDKIISSNMQIILAVNSEAKDIPKYENIKVVQVGKLKGSLWEQICLPLYVIKNKAKCVNLCNMMPILTPHIVVIHDINFKVNPKFYSKKFSLWYRLAFCLSIKRINKIITVSEFSKKEIIKNYGIKSDRITVIPNAWQHFQRIEFDENALSKYDLEKKKYYFAMSSMAPNKNFKWIAAAAKNNPNKIFAVSGSINKKVFGNIFDFDIPSNLKFLGYVSDEEAKTLMRDCKAFLFPTFYEGFGIPPLEALSVDAKVVVSDASCMREIFGDSVFYVDPHEYNADLNNFKQPKSSDIKKTLSKYSWKSSSEKLMKSISND